MKVEIGVIDKYKNTYPLIIDEEVWQVVHVSIFGKSPVFSDASIDELNESFALLEYKGAKSFVLKRIAQKNYHTQELISALSERNVSKQTSLSVIKELIAKGYLNDSSWIASFVRTLRSQRFGFKAILFKLMHKGVSKEEAYKALEKFQETENQENSVQNSIEQLLNTRYRNRELSIKKERDKVIAGLIRKGYELHDILEVLLKII